MLAHKFMRSGALAITLAALSSFDDAVRAAAYTVLSRYLSQLQMARCVIVLRICRVAHFGTQTHVFFKAMQPSWWG